MLSADLYRSLFVALHKRDAGEIAKTAYECLNMPIVVTDAAFVVIAKYPDSNFGDEQWDANRVGEQIEPRFLETFREDGHFARHIQADLRPVLIDWGHYLDRPRLTALVRSKTSIMGFMSALATGCEVEPWHYEAISTIAEAYAILEETGLGTKSRHFDFSAASFYGMLSGARSTDATGMRERFVKHVPGPYLLMSAQMRDPSGTPLECCFASELERTLDPMVQIVYDETLYILLGGISHDGDLDPVRETVGKALKNLGVLCGVSRPFSDVDDILQSKWQADRALRIGSVVDSDHSVFFYDDLIADIVLDEITTRAPRVCVEPLAIRDLRQRDSRSGTEYVKTLEHFLLCGRDRKTTAEALHIHRNTLSYRLDRIRETLGKGGCGVYETLYFALLRHAERMSRGNSAAGDEQELLDWGEERS